MTRAERISGALWAAHSAERRYRHFQHRQGKTFAGRLHYFGAFVAGAARFCRKSPPRPPPDFADIRYPACSSFPITGELHQ